MNELKTWQDQRLLETINDVTEELTKSAANKSYISEDFFVNVFLRMFAGEPAFLDKVKPEMWFNIAHGPFNEVTVVDAKGQVLYDVPAYFSQAAIKPLDGTGKAEHLPSITDVVRQSNHHAFRGAGQGEAFLMQELERRSFMFDTNVDVTEDAKRWMAIFERYGVKPVRPVEQTLKQPEPNVDSSRDSSEFDPLP